MSQDLTALVRQIQEDPYGNTRSAARLMTLIQNAPWRTPELFSALRNAPQCRMVVGVTGTAGTGKSVLINRLITSFRLRQPDRRVGVIAVDPSSPFTGGAFLADRLRMMRHATDPFVFVRSCASRGQAGGLMPGIRGLVGIMGLMGCDVVLVETVGVGQGEVAIAKIADLVVVLLTPDHGDESQLLKSGLMEIADAFVVSKTDREGVQPLLTQLTSMLRLVGHQAGHRKPASVFPVSALEGKGIDALLDHLESCFERDHARWWNRREAAVHEEIEKAVMEESQRQVSRILGMGQLTVAQVEKILASEVTVPELVAQLFAKTVDLQRNEALPHE